MARTCGHRQHGVAAVGDGRRHRRDVRGRCVPMTLGAAQQSAHRVLHGRGDVRPPAAFTLVMMPMLMMLMLLMMLLLLLMLLMRVLLLTVVLAHRLVVVHHLLQPRRRRRGCHFVATRLHHVHRVVHVRSNPAGFLAVRPLNEDDDSLSIRAFPSSSGVKRPLRSTERLRRFRFSLDKKEPSLALAILIRCRCVALVNLRWRCDLRTIPFPFLSLTLKKKNTLLARRYFLSPRGAGTPLPSFGLSLTQCFPRFVRDRCVARLRGSTRLSRRLLGNLRCKRESESVFDAAAADVERKSARSFHPLLADSSALFPERREMSSTAVFDSSSRLHKARSRAQICPFSGRKRNRARMRFVGSFLGIFLNHPSMIALLDNAILRGPPVRERPFNSLAVNPPASHRELAQLAQAIYGARLRRHSRAIHRSSSSRLSEATSPWRPLDRSHLSRSSRYAICGSEETLEKPSL